MGGINGNSGVGLQQLRPMQQVGSTESAPVGNEAPKIGHLGSHTVKVAVSPSGSQQILQNKESLRSSLGSGPSAPSPLNAHEKSVASFLSQTDALGAYINRKLAALGQSEGTLTLGSSLSRTINSRAGEWIDTMYEMRRLGVSAGELDRMSADLVKELRGLVDKAFAQGVPQEAPKAATKRTTVRARPNVPTEASRAYGQRAAAVLGKALGKTVRPEQTHVLNNIGGGSCFFHSALEQLAKLEPARWPESDTVGSANRLRGELINHAKMLKAKLDKGALKGLVRTTTTFSDGEEIVNVFAQTEKSSAPNLSAEKRLSEMRPITDGFDLALEPEFEAYGADADVSTGALLADYLQRPVVIVTQEESSGKDMNVEKFEHGLESGRKLDGEPLIIYYCRPECHFMAVSVDH